MSVLYFKRVMNEKWRMTIDLMLIVGKYLSSSQDYVNLMKTCKKYSSLVLYYRYNPIGDDRLFKNIETQHFYEYADIFYRKRAMYNYVYWIDRSIIIPYLFKIDASHCTIKDININRMLMYAGKMGFVTPNFKLFTHPFDFIELVKNLDDFYIVFLYGKDYFGLYIHNSMLKYPKEYNSFCFINDTILDLKCDVFMSAQPPYSKMYIRNTTDLNDIICIDASSLGIRIEINNKTLQNYLPSILNAHGWCIIKNSKQSGNNRVIQNIKVDQTIQN